MAAGMGVFGWAPLVFWSLTPKELDAALRGRFGISGGLEALSGADLAALIKQFPDQERNENGE